MGGQSVLQETPGRAALFAAGVHDRPDAGVPLSAHQRAAALGDAAVDHCGTNALLGGLEEFDGFLGRLATCWRSLATSFSSSAIRRR